STGVGRGLISTSGLIFSVVAAGTQAPARSAMALWGRPSMILRAWTSPMPGRVWSSSAVAEFRSIGPFAGSATLAFSLALAFVSVLVAWACAVFDVPRDAARASVRRVPRRRARVAIMAQPRWGEWTDVGRGDRRDGEIRYPDDNG